MAVSSRMRSSDPSNGRTAALTLSKVGSAGRVLSLRVKSLSSWISCEAGTTCTVLRRATLALVSEFIFAGRFASPRIPSPGLLGRGLRCALFHPILKATANGPSWAAAVERDDRSAEYRRIEGCWTPLAVV